MLYFYKTQKNITNSPFRQNKIILFFQNKKKKDYRIKKLNKSNYCSRWNITKV